MSAFIEILNRFIDFLEFIYSAPRLFRRSLALILISMASVVSVSCGTEVGNGFPHEEGSNSDDPDDNDSLSSGKAGDSLSPPEEAPVFVEGIDPAILLAECASPFSEDLIENSLLILFETDLGVDQTVIYAEKKETTWLSILRSDKILKTTVLEDGNLKTTETDGSPYQSGYSCSDVTVVQDVTVEGDERVFERTQVLVEKDSVQKRLSWYLAPAAGGRGLALLSIEEFSIGGGDEGASEIIWLKVSDPGKN